MEIHIQPISSLKYLNQSLIMLSDQQFSNSDLQTSRRSLIPSLGESARSNRFHVNLKTFLLFYCVDICTDISVAMVSQTTSFCMNQKAALNSVSSYYILHNHRLCFKKNSLMPFNSIHTKQEADIQCCCCN